jgi:sigma-E factor negative regulatory protein RseA
MNQHISALMDGELFDDEADALLGNMKRRSDGLETWGAYHLIGDVLRQPGHVPVDLSAAICRRLQDEATVLAPQRRTERDARWFAVAAAASIMALSTVAWLSAQAGSPAEQRMAMQPAPLALAASAPARHNMSEYLMAHQDYSPSANVQAASFVRTVSDHQ